MTFLELVVALHQEAKLPGDPPDAVTGQTGRAADLVRWTVEAWKDIQRDNQGRWKWMRRPFTLDTVADTASYAYGDATDTLLSTAIARFKSWDLDRRDPFHCYLVSEGEASESPLTILSWAEFRYQYGRGTHTSARPGAVAVDVFGNLHFGPTPSAIYRVSGDYWASVQTLAEADEEDEDDVSDIPEMPADYHMAIPYRAMTKYAYNVVARELLARVAYDGAEIMRALKADQDYDRFAFSLPGPIGE